MVNHIDGNGLNNSMSNLEWVTHRENCLHAKQHGLLRPKRGSSHMWAKLSDDEVAEIISEYAKGTKLKEIAERFKVSESTVSRTATGVRRSRSSNICVNRYTTQQRQEVK